MSRANRLAELTKDLPRKWKRQRSSAIEIRRQIFSSKSLEDHVRRLHIINRSDALNHIWASHSRCCAHFAREQTSRVQENESVFVHEFKRYVGARFEVAGLPDLTHPSSSEHALEHKCVSERDSGSHGKGLGLQHVQTSTQAPYHARLFALFLGDRRLRARRPTAPPCGFAPHSAIDVPSSHSALGARVRTIALR